MEKAKAAVGDFMKKAGHHDTTVHETVSPGVTHETIKPHHHDEVQTAVDKEVHQDHYHRTVQPVVDREVLPEQHTAKLGAVQHRDFDHRDHESTKRALVEEQGQFRDDRVVQDTSHSQSAAAAIGGEHVHHHIHETIQPVVEKETIQPNVVHTTVPIHETHHNTAKHHETSRLPTVSMDQYKTKGGVLGGREERYDGFEGEPHNIGGTLTDMRHGKHDSQHTHREGAIKESTHGDFDPLDGERRDQGRGVGTGATGASATSTAGGAGFESRREHDQTRGGGFGRDLDREGITTSNTSSTSQTKPSLTQKLDPRVDANNDGKAGFMK